VVEPLASPAPDEELSRLVDRKRCFFVGLFLEIGAPICAAEVAKELGLSATA
jgi:hypothetical protein